MRRARPRQDKRSAGADGTIHRHNPNLPERGYPRWIVASGLVLYCCMFWAALIAGVGALPDATKWLWRSGVEVAALFTGMGSP